MAAQVLLAVEIHPETLFDSDGVVRRWIVDVTAEVKAVVRSKAPPNRSRATWPGRPTSRRLLAAIYGTSGRAGPVQDTGEVGVHESMAPYAKFVLGGTGYQGTRYIYRNKARKGEADFLYNLERRGVFIEPERMRGIPMRLPPYGAFKLHHIKVKGQRANNFLFDGYNVVARAHQALGEFRNPYAF